MASAIMKPVGSVVHLRRGTVHLGLVRWLCIGSIPGAFSGVRIARALGRGEDVQNIIRIALGVALLLAAMGHRPGPGGSAGGFGGTGTRLVR
ncbi:MAG TPA: hypothetical protein VFH26_06940 [Gemmatimonadales bacterium]|nr:hypothetical protein [Gemmatimonadales bacterium]